MRANESVSEPEADRTVVITRVFDAPARLLFEAYSKPEHIMRWFGPKGWPVTMCEMDFRVGGSFRFAMTGPSGRQNTPFGGEYREIVPNRKIVVEIIYNYTAERRVALTVEIGYGGDLDSALRTVQEVLADNPRVLKDPAPEVGITKLADSGIEITLRPWCKAEDYWHVHYEVYRAILDRFRERRIEIPYPHYEVRLLNAAS